MNAEFGAIGTVTITFRDRFQDTLIYSDVIGYQIGGGAFGVTEKNGKTTIYNWDEISSVVHEIKE